MAKIIQRVEKRNLQLMASGEKIGILVLSDINSVTASLNAVPSECSIYLDRRMVLGETVDSIKNEMDEIIKGKNASWEIGTLEIGLEDDLTQASNAAFESVYGKNQNLMISGIIVQIRLRLQAWGLKQLVLDQELINWLI